MGDAIPPEIGAQLAKGRFDAVLVQGWRFKTFLQTIFAAKQLGLPLLARGDSHMDTPRSVLKKATKFVVYPPFLRIFDAALYVGQRSYSYWRHYGYPSSRLFFSPHCVDTEWFRTRATVNARGRLRAQLGIPPETAVILFAGKLVSSKRPLDVVDAAAQMKAAGNKITLLVAGAGPLQREMMSAARDAGVAFHALGFCNQSKMPAVYAAADILVLPSESETWGLVANEALASGRPIVLADTVGAAPDLASDKTAGRVFPVGNVKALANAISDILRCPPSPEMIAKKSAGYSLNLAVKGIHRAAGFVTKSRSWQSMLRFHRAFWHYSARASSSGRSAKISSCSLHFASRAAKFYA